TVQDHVLGDPIAEPGPAVANAAGYFVDPLKEFDGDIESLLGEHVAMLRNPNRQIEVVPRNSGKGQLLHLHTPITARPSSTSRPGCLDRRPDVRRRCGHVEM